MKVAGSYGIYAASALSSNTVFRSILGGTLPLAGSKMYQNLTPHWAGTLLGLIELCLVPIPFIFWRFGKRIRSRSRAILQIQKDAEAERNRTSRS